MRRIPYRGNQQRMWLGHFGASAGVVERTRAVGDSAPLKLTYKVVRPAILQIVQLPTRTLLRPPGGPAATTVP